MMDFERQQPEEFEPATIVGRLLVYLASPESEGPNGMRNFTDMITAQFAAIPVDQHQFIESTFPVSSGSDVLHRNHWGYYLTQRMVDFADAVERDIKKFEQESMNVEFAVMTMDMELPTIMTPPKLG